MFRLSKFYGVLVKTAYMKFLSILSENLETVTMLGKAFVIALIGSPLVASDGWHETEECLIRLG